MGSFVGEKMGIEKKEAPILLSGSATLADGYASYNRIARLGRTRAIMDSN